MSKVSTVKRLAELKLNGKAEIELLQSKVKFNIICTADPSWLRGSGYNHIDWQYATKADFDKHRAIAGRSWNFLAAALRFSGHEFAVAVHSFNHSVRITANGYDIVSPIVTRATERDKNGNWTPGHHMCMWCGDTYRLRGNSTASYDINGRNAVQQAERLLGASTEPEPKPVAVNRKVRVTGTNVNIRTGAGTNFSVVGKVSRPTEFTIVKESNGQGANKWGQISGGNYGARWIALDFTEIVSEVVSPVLLPLDDIAREVIAGKWGNDPVRSQRLTAAGYDAQRVQQRVRQMLGVE